MKKAAAGFTLIEVLIFIMVSTMLVSTFALVINNVLLKAPAVNNQKVALETARACMEWFLQQRNINGYSTYSCPSTPTATYCTAPTGYTVSTSISCTTWNADANYKTLTVAVTGLASVSLTTLLGSY